MIAIQSIVGYLGQFYDDYSDDYSQDEHVTIDLEKNFQRYSFLQHHAEKGEAIDRLFQQTVSQGSKKISVSSLMQASELRPEDLNALIGMGFNQLSPNPQIGIVLEHPSLPGWLIKKNYGLQKDSHGSLKRIIKCVSASDFPLWVLPPSLQDPSKGGEITIRVPNEVIHPLRVVMLKRGRRWIRELKLSNIKAAKEYLYLLPDADHTKPLHERVVVISKKENILSESDNLNRFAQMAHHCPEKLKEIVHQMILLIKPWKITDAHLGNFRFLNDHTNTIIAIDGEPIGALADSSQPLMVKAIQEFDPVFYSLMGLKKLKASIGEQMAAEKMKTSDIRQVQAIFDEQIDAAISSLASYEVWHYIKKTALQSPELSVAVTLFQTVMRNIPRSRFLN